MPVRHGWQTHLKLSVYPSGAVGLPVWRGWPARLVRLACPPGAVSLPVWCNWLARLARLAFPTGLVGLPFCRNLRSILVCLACPSGAVGLPASCVWLSRLVQFGFPVWCGWRARMVRLSRSGDCRPWRISRQTTEFLTRQSPGAPLVPPSQCWLAMPQDYCGPGGGNKTKQH